MRKLILLFLGATLVPLSVSADVTAKVRELMKVQGQLDMWQQQIDFARIEGRKQADKILDQFMSHLNPTTEFRDRFKAASNRFVDKLQNQWTAEQIVAVWAKYYAPHFTEPELDQLISFYKSDLGQKEVKATKSTLVEFSRYFQRANANVMKNAVNEYIADLQLVAKECNCRRTK